MSTTMTRRPTLPGSMSLTGTDADVTASGQAFANRSGAFVVVARQTSGAHTLTPYRTAQGAEDATPRGTRVAVVSPQPTAPMPWAVVLPDGTRQGFRTRDAARAHARTVEGAKVSKA